MAALRRRTAVPSMACVWELGGIGVFVSSATQWLRGAFKCCAKETCDVSLWWRCCVLHSSGCSAHWACCLWQYFKKMRRTAHFPRHVSGQLSLQIRFFFLWRRGPSLGARTGRLHVRFLKGKRSKSQLCGFGAEIRGSNCCAGVC